MLHKKKNLLIIDGDIIVFRCASATEYSIDWDSDGDTSYIFNEQELYNSIDSYIKTFTDLYPSDKIFVCFSGSRNFRKEIFPEYKANRNDLHKPTLLKLGRKYIEDNYESKCFDNIEADDLMGIIATDPKVTRKYNVVMVSNDKDMQQIPYVTIYNLQHKTSSVFTEDESDIYHLYQTMCGDTVDNYKGAVGIGSKKAQKILDYCIEKEYNALDRWEHVVKEAFKGDEEYALLMARCAKILRYEDYDRDSGEVKLWSASLS